MHRIFLFSLLAVISVTACRSTKNRPDCSSLKKGNFEYRGGYSNTSFLITRNDSVQTERNEKTGDGVKLAIKWTDPCAYELSMISYLAGGKDSAINPADFPTIKTSILNVTENYYICKSVMNGRNLRRMDTILILK